jgi:hypothetical protein
VNLEALDNDSTPGRSIQAHEPNRGFDHFYDAVSRGSFSDEESEADADSLTTSETLKHKRGNLEFELLLKELKNILHMDRIPSDAIPPVNETHQEFSKEENYLFELLLEKVKRILRSEGQNAEGIFADDKDLSASKEENEIFELLLLEVKSLLAGRQFNSSLVNEKSPIKVDNMIDNSLTSSMLRNHLMNPRISQKFKKSLKLISAVPDIGSTPRVQAKTVAEVPMISKEKMAAYFSAHLESVDSHDIDFETTYANTLSNLKAGSNVMRDAKASRALTTASDSTPYTVRFSDIYPEAEYFYSADGLFMQRGLIGAVDARFISPESKEFNRPRRLVRTRSFDSEKSVHAPRQLAIPRTGSFDTIVNSSPRPSLRTTIKLAMRPKLSPEKKSIANLSPPSVPERDDCPSNAKIKAVAGSKVDAANAKQHQSPTRVHDMKLKFEKMIQRNIGDVHSPSKKTSLL